MARIRGGGRRPAGPRGGGGGGRRGGGGGAKPSVGMLVGGGVCSIVAGAICILGSVYWLDMLSRVPTQGMPAEIKSTLDMLKMINMAILGLGLAGTALGAMACAGNFGGALGAGIVNGMLTLLVLLGIANAPEKSATSFVMLALVGGASGLCFTGLSQATKLAQWKKGGGGFAGARPARRMSSRPPSMAVGTAGSSSDYVDDYYEDDYAAPARSAAPPPPPPPPPPGGGGVAPPRPTRRTSGRRRSISARRRRR